MRHDCPWTAGENRSHETTTASERERTDREHAAMHPHQPARGDPPTHRARAQPEHDELLQGHHAVLTSREIHENALSWGVWLIASSIWTV
jgi:hypothetical protein